MSDARVAVGGVVKTITASCVAMDGVVHQFWPPTTTPTGNPIRWNTDTIDVIESVVDPVDAYARILFYRDTGRFVYTNYPSEPTVAQYLSPVATATGQYLIKCHQVSGIALNGTLETWIDLYSGPTVEFSLLRSPIGSDTAVAEITIAEDDGFGAPAGGTEVTKTVNFLATVTASATTNITWSTATRTLIEYKESENADVSVTFNPLGFVTGSADTSGAFTESWNIDSPDCADPENYTVYATVIGGPNPTGSALDTLLTLDQVRSWTLATTAEGDDLDTTLDITVDDLVPVGNDVTKRIYLRPERGIPIAEPDATWITDTWSATDAGYPQGASLDVFIYFTFGTDGTASLEMETTALTRTEFDTGNWFDTPPPTSGELNDYEVMIDTTAMTGSLTRGVWYRMTEARAFTIARTTLPSSAKVVTFDANVRKVGGATFAKTVTITIIQSDGTTP